MKYLEIARRDIGTTEIKGVKHSSKISGWLKNLGAWWADDETPWCGVAVAAWMQEAGIPYPKQYYRAKSWMEWGIADNSTLPSIGSVAVIIRQGGGHVGLVTGISKDKKFVRLVGGNQGDKVCEAWFDTSRVLGYRFHPDCIQFYKNCPIAIQGEMSKSEA